MGKRMPIDSADSTRLKSDTATDIGEKVLRWFAQIGAAVIKPIKYFLRTRYSASDEKRAESTLEEAGAIAAATENAVANKFFTVPVNAEVKVDTDAQIDSAASTVPDQEEIQRRRDWEGQGNSAPLNFLRAILPEAVVTLVPARTLSWSSIEIVRSEKHRSTMRTRLRFLSTSTTH
jgi:hypothetical protein